MTDTFTVSFAALKRISAEASEHAAVAAEAAEVRVAGWLKPVRFIQKLADRCRAIKHAPRDWRASGRAPVAVARVRKKQTRIRKTGGR